MKPVHREKCNVCLTTRGNQPLILGYNYLQEIEYSYEFDNIKENAVAIE